MIFPLVFDATITREDFRRLLPRATDGRPFEEIAGGFQGEGWSIRLTPIPLLQIGQVRLERNRVQIEFDGLATEEQERFMLRFTQHYQRGGG